MAVRTDMSFGATVMGTNGKLGEIHRVIVDARSGTVTDLVVKHGFVFGGECMVPLSYVDRVDEDGTVQVTLDEHAFSAMEGFTNVHFHSPDPEYLGPPGFANEQFQLSSMQRGNGSMAGSTGKLLGYPGGEETSPDELQRPTFSAGTPIVDCDGEQVGELHELAWETHGGVPTRVVLRTGQLFHTETELPLSWVAHLSDAGVALNVARAQIESWADPELAKDQARQAGLTQVMEESNAAGVQAEGVTRRHMVAELDVQRGEADHARTG